MLYCVFQFTDLEIQTVLLSWLVLLPVVLYVPAVYKIHPISKGFPVFHSQITKCQEDDLSTGITEHSESCFSRGEGGFVSEKRKTEKMLIFVFPPLPLISHVW